MPRRGEVKYREVGEDPKYKSKLVAKFVNCIMRKGKKSIAESILYDAFDIIEQKNKRSAIEVI